MKKILAALSALFMAVAMLVTFSASPASAATCNSKASYRTDVRTNGTKTAYLWYDYCGGDTTKKVRPTYVRICAPDSEIRVETGDSVIGSNTRVRTGNSAGYNCIDGTVTSPWLLMSNTPYWNVMSDTNPQVGTLDVWPYGGNYGWNIAPGQDGYIPLEPLSDCQPSDPPCPVLS